MSQYFFEQMRALLGSRYNSFKEAFDNKPRHKALRVNTLKISADEFALFCERYERNNVREYALKYNGLCPLSFYTSVKPSLDPLYHAGLYYMQEPSASAAVTAFSPYIGKRVLDLCAAPGGKSTQAAAYMKGSGVIFCNDTDGKRVRALEENIVRLGVTNAVCTQLTAAEYRAMGLDGYFDTLIVDAPCSGGGMMRYEDVSYTPEIVEGCARRQRDILDDAAELLASGGYMLYSTCTFSPEENENNVRYIIEKGFVPVDIPLREGEERGIGIAEARRIYPMNFDGEGHFYCVLKKISGICPSFSCEKRGKPKREKAGGLSIDCEEIDGELYLARRYELPNVRLAGGDARSRHKLFSGAGVLVYERSHGSGKLKELSHALSHALTREQVAAVGAAELGEKASSYIRGEQIAFPAARGNLIATVEGYALGWAKCAPDGAGELTLKNLYPKNLRITY